MLRTSALSATSRVALSAVALLALAACADRMPTEPALAPEEAALGFGASPTISIIDLGTLAPPGFVRASAGARGINNPGQVVGTSHDALGRNRAFLWERRTGMIELPTLAGESHAVDINERGEIVGESENAEGAQRAVMWLVRR